MRIKEKRQENTTVPHSKVFSGKKCWDISDFHRTFIELESANQLQDLRVGGFRVWDYLRFLCFNYYATKLGILEKAHDSVPEGRASLISRVFTMLKYSFHSGIHSLKHAEILVWQHPRRLKPAGSMEWWDIYSDPILDNTALSREAFESKYLGGHFVPAHTKNLRYLDLPFMVVSALRVITSLFWFPTKVERKRLVEIDAAFYKAFEVYYPWKKKIRKVGSNRLVGMFLYRWILKRVSPKKVVIVCAYGKELLVETCKRLSVKVMEIQHGNIGPLHMGYHYPAPSDKFLVPDEFWSFGRYWQNQVKFPSGMKFKVLGFPYFHGEQEKYKSVTKKRQIVVLSQGTIGKALSKFLVDAVTNIPEDIHIFYKLHPGEYLRWRKEYSCLLEKPDRIQVIEGSSPPLYQMLAESTWQVGVYSTAIYEGLSFGCRTVLIDLPGIENVSDLMQLETVSVAKSPAELFACLLKSGISDADAFFDPMWKERVVDLLS